MRVMATVRALQKTVARRKEETWHLFLLVVAVLRGLKKGMAHARVRVRVSRSSRSRSRIQSLVRSAGAMHI